MGYSGADIARFLGITTSAVNRLAVSYELPEVEKISLNRFGTNVVPIYGENRRGHEAVEVGRMAEAKGAWRKSGSFGNLSPYFIGSLQKESTVGNQESMPEFSQNPDMGFLE